MLLYVMIFLDLFIQYALNYFERRLISEMKAKGRRPKHGGPKNTEPKVGCMSHVLRTEIPRTEINNCVHPSTEVSASMPEKRRSAVGRDSAGVQLSDAAWLPYPEYGSLVLGC